jgi:hypothetical protein
MFGHRSFLIIGGGSPADIKSLISGGYEILDCNFDFHQGIDRKGKATTRVYIGTFGLTGNLAVTYLGSYILKWKILSVDFNTKTAIIEFKVENSSTMQSASRPPIIGYWYIWQNSIGKIINNAFDSGPGSKTTQSIKWEETIKF